MSANHDDTATGRFLPLPRQPGTLFEQFMAIAVFLAGDEEVRNIDRDAAWQRARAEVMPHVRASSELSLGGGRGVS